MSFLPASIHCVWLLSNFSTGEKFGYYYVKPILLWIQIVTLGGGAKTMYGYIVTVMVTSRCSEVCLKLLILTNDTFRCAFPTPRVCLTPLCGLWLWLGQNEPYLITSERYHKIIRCHLSLGDFTTSSAEPFWVVDQCPAHHRLSLVERNDVETLSV